MDSPCFLVPGCVAEAVQFSTVLYGSEASSYGSASCPHRIRVLLVCVVFF